MNEQKRIKIMLVDDDKHLLTSLSDFLSFEGFDVAKASSAEDALRQLERVNPELIVLDISMPGMGGLGFLREMSDSDGKPRVPIIVLTARAAMENFFDSIDADGFLAKPCPGAEVVKEIRAVMARRAAGERKRRSTQASVLLVESSRASAERISDHLTEKGFSVDIVPAGLEIFKRADRVKPDVIVMREMLPTMRGSAVAIMARDHRATRGLPVVLYDKTMHVDLVNPRAPELRRCADIVVLSDRPEALVEAIHTVLDSEETEET